MEINDNIDETLWQKKAAAFVTRSHRHLWGKNNEDPHIFLYKQGLKNEFIKQVHLGWNKHGQERAADNWGISTTDAKTKIRLPAGIVIPCIVDRQLLSVFIQPFEITQPPVRVLGSLSNLFYLKGQTSLLVVVRDIFEALLIFQETRKQASCAVIPSETSQNDPLVTKCLQTHQKGISFCEMVPEPVSSIPNMVSYSETSSCEQKIAIVKTLL